MITEAEENDLASTLNKFIISKTKNKAYITESCFYKILVQFRALGLIEESIKNRLVKDKGNYWKLSNFGKQTMTKLIAIKK